MPAQAMVVEDNAAPAFLAKKPKRAEIVITDNTTVAQAFNSTLEEPNRLALERGLEFIEYNKLKLAYPYRWQDPKALVGLEVEIENVLHIDPNLTLGFWRVEEDGSLRNNGREFKTLALPLTFVEHALTQLSKGVNANVDFSIRTSVHVHQDVRGLTMNQLICLMLAYTSIENLLFKYAGNNRRNSIYCVPLVDTDLFTWFSSKEDIVKTLTRISGVWTKYTAFNLLPIQTFGTVEYRHMPGTLDVKRLLVWVDLLSRLKLFAMKTPYEELLSIIRMLNTNSQYEVFLDRVVGDLMAYLDISDLKGAMEKSIYMVKNACIANEFHQKVLSTPIQDGSQLSLRWQGRNELLELLKDKTMTSAFVRWRNKCYPFEDPVALYKMVITSPDIFIQGTKNGQHPEMLPDLLLGIGKAKRPSKELYGF